MEFCTFHYEIPLQQCNSITSLEVHCFHDGNVFPLKYIIIINFHYGNGILLISIIVTEFCYICYKIPFSLL